MVVNARGLVVVQGWSMNEVRSARLAVAIQRQFGERASREALREEERRRTAIQPTSVGGIEVEDCERWDGLS